MGTIIARKRKDRTTAYLAQVLVKRRGAIVHREARTFDRKQAAAAWLEKRESELGKPGALDRVKVEDLTLAVVIDRYTDELIKKIGRTKAQVLRAIKNYDIARARLAQRSQVPTWSPLPINWSPTSPRRPSPTISRI